MQRPAPPLISEKIFGALPRGMRPPNAPLPTVPFHAVPNPVFVVAACYFRAVDQAYCWLFYIKHPDGSYGSPIRTITQDRCDATPLRLYVIVQQRKQQKKKCFVPPSNLWTLHIFVSPQMSYLCGLFLVLVTY